ncbi:mitogen-activated protein kinase kinase kinase 10 isoform X2 [Ricinus communis]|uniref:Serine-threonine protein kinase, putative n=2 Tax=Ricinus communis TaxID=3988 RepID=B9T342_RICCO|nr:mitogen-activated protein kinase kinase kinase 10 isoform X2 [Ricinus communis]EEF29734.1 serine-threonine protein kinase, putative [Ricinus communis]|eukprot:XP_002532661.1 mitogen-activated protein kinase kinase kinase 10 [Ricinus communis]
MERFRQIGEVLGSLKALMVFHDNIQINKRQCCLLVDIFIFAYDTIAEEMKQNLRFEEKHTKWRILEQPLREILRTFKDGEGYIKQCLETKDWWAKAVTLYQNTDCVQLYIHNLLTCIPIVIEAIETTGEFSGWDQDEIQKKRLVYSNKYQKQWKDPQLFHWKFAKQHLITQDFCERFDVVWKEDRWILLNKIKEKTVLCSRKYERQLRDLLVKNLEEQDTENAKLLPSSILVGSKDYHVRRRLGNGSQYKEILWLGESLAIRHFFGDIQPLVPEISSLLSLSHPNISYFFCGFTDEEKKECFLVMELMSRDMCSYIKEICGPRKRSLPFSLPVAVDIMLQIARGMEYLHSKKIYHGDLNPSNILVKPRSTTEGYVHVKVSGFGLSSFKKNPSKQNGTLSFIWYAPEVLEEQEQTGSAPNSKYTEKSDVYSFGMVCFGILTGKVPFDDSHLQGEKMSRNIRAGERPLFPLNSPKYVTNLTKRCWQADPNQRPSFSSICRILRYTKRFLAMNPDYNRELDPLMPAVDYVDMDSKLLRKYPSWDAADSSQIAQIPFQMFVCRVIEKEKTRVNQKETSESGSDKASVSGDENMNITDDPFPSPTLPSPTGRKFLTSPDTLNRKPSMSKRSPDVIRSSRQAGTPKGRSRPPQLAPFGRGLRMNSESQLMMMISPRMRRTSSGHASDSEIS